MTLGIDIAQLVSFGKGDVVRLRCKLLQALNCSPLTARSQRVAGAELSEPLEARLEGSPSRLLQYGRRVLRLRLQPAPSLAGSLPHGWQRFGKVLLATVLVKTPLTPPPQVAGCTQLATAQGGTGLVE